MGRSFQRAAPGETVRDFYHQASDTHYSMLARDGKYYQRRWQIGFDGKEINAEELPVDFVMGSGNHARTYLSRTARGALLQLPLGWYSEKGGSWAMNPGYDTAHPPSHRPIAYECMFCHNAYPQVPAGHEEASAEPLYAGSMPEGIDCQRCHGPGAKHIAAARAGGAIKAQDIRASVVNPARLSKDRQMEVCMQCHLETASTRLPSLVRRFGRGPFAYVAGQPLDNFVLSFDHAPGSGYDDKFDIAGGAYRLRQSQCFLKSKGEMTCQTCHDPHNIRRGADAAPYYARICRECHAAALDRLTASNAHPANPDCVSCHMPKRRTDDAVHVVMTDHRIQRRAPERNLLAELQESHPAPAQEYRGEVVPYYPLTLLPSPESTLYLALAQVRDGRNLAEGIQRLTDALTRAASPRPEFYMALGDAWHAAGDPGKSAIAYQQAVRLQPNSARASRYLGIALHEAGQQAGATRALQRALQLAPRDASSWFERGLIAADEGRTADALALLQKAIAINPDLPDFWNGLGVTENARGNAEAAGKAFRKALLIDPYYAAAHGNLARLLASQGDFPQAVYYFEKATRLQPSNAANLYEYALTLVRMNRFEDSQREVEAAVRADPNLAEAHELLGGLLSRKKNIDAALAEYREAVRLKPEFSRAQLDLAATLAAQGDQSGAILHFREAAKSTDPRIAGAAGRALRQIGGTP
ncbi:MAG: tetratricopeptide repeat protein [Acidobacteriota bacterium]